MAKKILSPSSKLNDLKISAMVQSLQSIDQNNPSGFIKQMVINPLMSAMTNQDEEAKMQKLKEIHQMLKAVNYTLMNFKSIRTCQTSDPAAKGVVGVASCPSAVSMARKSRDHDHGFNWLLNLGCWLLALGIVPAITHRRSLNKTRLYGYGWQLGSRNQDQDRSHLDQLCGSLRRDQEAKDACSHSTDPDPDLGPDLNPNPKEIADLEQSVKVSVAPIYVCSIGGKVVTREH
ncbi:GD13510 [Drosophila simulans]|uniref:GD13510 n=1 Tax=Drosophila simulans TaxID=7240 RepID=B4QLF0_DROSI|nr:GD13510 [Drosophila simulans]